MFTSLGCHCWSQTEATASLPPAGTSQMGALEVAELPVEGPGQVAMMGLWDNGRKFHPGRHDRGLKGRVQGLMLHVRASLQSVCGPGWGCKPTLNVLVSFQQNPVIPPVMYTNPTYVSDFSGRVEVRCVLGS